MPLTEDGLFRLTKNAEVMGLDCTPDGVTLAGVTLLRGRAPSLAPRPPEEIASLVGEAFGREVNAGGVSAGLDVIARALNQGDLGRAMVATLQLNLPKLNSETAQRIVKANVAIRKYNPDEPRDSRGRWTTGDDTGSGNSAAHLIPAGWSDEFEGDGDPTCLLAAHTCEVAALKDSRKGRTPYFDSCLTGQEVCNRLIKISGNDPGRLYSFKFPNNTVVSIRDGIPLITWVDGIALHTPVR